MKEGIIMKNQTTLLRIAYWTGAVLDGIMVFPLLFPKVAGIMFKNYGLQSGGGY